METIQSQRQLILQFHNNAHTEGGLKVKSDWDTARNKNSQIIPAGTNIFTDASNSDFTLSSAATMCIDNGNTSIYGFMTTDLAGNSRQVGTVDIGCYEYQK